MSNQPEPTIPRGIRLTEATWKRLDKLRTQHGSYEKALRVMLNGKPSKRKAS